MSTVSWSPCRSAGPAWQRWTLAVAVALVVTGPWLLRGYVLSYDMVFVPRPALGAGGLGLDGRVPRAVPGDFLVALAARVVRSDLLEQAVLVSILVAAVLGAWRLSPAQGAVGRAASGLLYGWNPFVYERLVLGHWALLVGYAALPWAVVAAVRLRDPSAATALARVGVPGRAARRRGRDQPHRRAAGRGGRRRRAGRARIGARGADGSLAGAGAAVLLNAPWWLPAAARRRSARRPDRAWARSRPAPTPRSAWSAAC